MKRLSAICGIICKCDVFADVGCDHGLISKYVLDNNLANKVIAADISDKCLIKAKKMLYGYDGVEFICTDGLNGINADTAVIAGLGGLTIIGILSEKLNGTVFILQPQDHVYALRLFLTQNGYRILSDFLVKENGKYYDIMLAEQGEQKLDRFQAEFGVFYDNGGAILKEKLYKEYENFCGYNDGGKNSEKRSFLKDAIERITNNQT